MSSALTSPSLSLIPLYLITLSLVTFNLIAILNVFTFPRLGANSDAGLRTPVFSGFQRPVSGGKAKHLPGDLEPSLPFVSVLIPARNEASTIGETIRRLLAQDYPSFEVIVLDDNSTDGTPQQACTAAGSDSRFNMLVGAPLPPGWLGKNWACHQLAGAARGDLLVFTDADVAWSTGALSALVDLTQALRADMLTVWPTQHTLTWGERLTVPLMALAILGYLPLPVVHHIPWAAFAAANGQCLCFRRAAYERSGGHASVRGSVIEDIHLARGIKTIGLQLRMADGAGLISCRMYTGWPSARDGYAKNILAGHGGKISLLAISAVFHWLVFLLPWLWLALGWVDRWWPGGVGPVWPLWPLVLVLLGISLRTISAAFTRQRVADSLLLPVSTFLMTLIAVRAIGWQWRFGGPQWKGRSVVIKER